MVTFGVALKDDNESLSSFLKSKKLPKSVAKSPGQEEATYGKSSKVYTVRESFS